MNNTYTQNAMKNPPAMVKLSDFLGPREPDLSEKPFGSIGCLVYTLGARCEYHPSLTVGQVNESIGIQGRLPRIGEHHLM